MDQKEIKTARLNFVTTPAIRKKLEILAKKERRSLSSMIEKILADAVKNEK